MFFKKVRLADVILISVRSDISILFIVYQFSVQDLTADKSEMLGIR